MDLQQQALIVAGIRDKMKESIGTKVYIKVNLGRSRVNENDATIIEAHPSVFIAKLEYRRGRTAEQSFQYADILTGVVEVLLDDKPMFGPFDIQPDAPLVDSANKPKIKKRLRPVKPFEQRIRLSSEQVAMLAERLKKEAEDKKTSSEHSSIISDLSHKYDLMKKAEKTKSTWNNVDKKQLAELAKKAKADVGGARVAENEEEEGDSRLSEILKNKDVLKNLILSEEEAGVVEKKSSTTKKVATPKKTTATKKVTTPKKTTAAKKASSSKAKTSTKKSSAKKKTATKSVAGKKATTKAKAKPKAEKKTSVKKAATKTPAKKTDLKKTAAKKSASKKPAAKKSTTTKKAATKTEKKPDTKAKTKSKAKSSSKSKTTKKK